jgi:hypothetical protein
MKIQHGACVPKSSSMRKPVVVHLRIVGARRRLTRFRDSFLTRARSPIRSAGISRGGDDRCGPGGTAALEFDVRARCLRFGAAPFVKDLRLLRPEAPCRRADRRWLKMPLLTSGPGTIRQAKAESGATSCSRSLNWSSIGVAAREQRRHAPFLLKNALEARTPTSLGNTLPLAGSDA